MLFCNFISWGISIFFKNGCQSYIIILCITVSATPIAHSHNFPCNRIDCLNSFINAFAPIKMFKTYTLISCKHFQVITLWTAIVLLTYLQGCARIMEYVNMSACLVTFCSDIQTVSKSFYLYWNPKNEILLFYHLCASPHYSIDYYFNPRRSYAICKILFKFNM